MSKRKLNTKVSLASSHSYLAKLRVTASVTKW